MSLLKKLKESKYVKKDFEGETIFIKLLSVKEFNHMAGMADTENEIEEMKNLIVSCVCDESKNVILTREDLEDLDFKTFSELGELVIQAQIPDDKKKAKQN